MLTGRDGEDDVAAILLAEADGYLLKDMKPEDIVAWLEQSTDSRLVIGTRLAGLIARTLRDEPRPASVYDAGLTPAKERHRRLADGFACSRRDR
jgi:two-component system nitrate/nitrite response regulator NarL